MYGQHLGLSTCRTKLSGNTYHKIKDDAFEPNCMALQQLFVKDVYCLQCVTG